VLRSSYIQAVRHVHEGRDVFLRQLTGFVNPSSMKFSLVLGPSHKAAMCEGHGYEAAMMFILVLAPLLTIDSPKAALWVGPRWARCVYDAFYREKNGIRCACANSATRPCGRGPSTRLIHCLLDGDKFYTGETRRISAVPREINQECYSTYKTVTELIGRYT